MIHRVCGLKFFSSFRSDLPNLIIGSATYNDMNGSFSVTYGSGSAAGVLGRDTVQLAGFDVPNQVFGVFIRMDAFTRFTR